MIKAGYSIRKRTRKLKSRMMTRMDNRRNRAMERQHKANKTMREAVKKTRRAKHRLNRAQRKAAKTGKVVDKLKIQRARAANADTARAAKSTTAATNRRQQR